MEVVIVHVQELAVITNIHCNINALLSVDLFMVYIPECKQQLRAMK